MNGFSLTLWLHLKTMENDFDPIRDYTCADLPTTPEQIDLAFKTLPWCQRVTANGNRWTRKEWKELRRKEKEETERKRPNSALCEGAKGDDEKH